MSGEQINSGYKRTEVGVIPNDWRVASVKDIAVVGRGRVISHREIAKAISPEYPVYSSQTFNEGIMGYLDSYDFEGEYITWTTDGANAGTIFYRNGKFNCTNVCGTIKPLNDDAYFVSKALSAVAPKHVSRNLGNPKLMNDVVKQIIFALPTNTTEQRAISTTLSDADTLIARLDQLIAKKRDLKQAAMQQLLTGQTRLPGFAGEWEVKRIEQICSLRTERIDPRIEGAQEFCIELEHIEPASGRLLGSSIASEQTSLKSKFKVGDVLFGKLRAYQRKYWVASLPGVCSTEIWVLVANPGLLTPEFLYHLVTTNDFIEAASTAYGTHMPRSDWKVVRQVQVALPGLYEQTAIAAVLSDMDAELATLEARRDKTVDIKQGMMQKLLTGSIRLI